MKFEIFHDQGTGYMSNLEPTEKDSVTLRLRADRGAVTEAVIQYSADGSCWNEILMERKGQDATGYYEFWEGTIPAMQERYHYRFRAAEAGETVYLGSEGMSEETPIPSDCFSVIPGFSTPDWAKGIIWYSVMPDAFYNGDVLNDMAEGKLKKTVPWGSTLQGLYEYYGGDIKGIRSKIGYIKELGVEGFYVNPMWTSDSDAGYGPNNYFETSPNYGNEEDFITLCKELHENGFPVMIDAVFSYSQANSIFTNSNGLQPLSGAFESQNSEYSDMFRFSQWPTGYVHKWGGIENDLGSDKARDLLWRGEESVLKRYLRPPYNADGWRFDAINSYAGTDTTLTKIGAEIRRETKSVKPDVLLVGEDYSKDTGLSGNWDAMQNSFFIFSALLWMKGGQFDQFWLVDRLYKMAKLPRPMSLCMYNNYENHDNKRLLDNYDTDKYKIKSVWLLQMTFIGSPVIYYGAENGAGKENDPTARNCFNWNERTWNYEIRGLCKALCELRKEYTALKEGPFQVGLVDNERQLTVYGRWDDNGSVVTMLNQREYDQEMLLNLKQYNIGDGAVVCDYLTGQTYTVEQGCALVRIAAGGSILVTGKAGNYRGRLKLMDNGAEIHVIMPKPGCYVLDGKGQAVKNSVAITPVFGCDYIEANITKEATGGALVLGEYVSDWQISAVFTERGLAVFGADGTLLCEKALPEEGKIRLGMCPEGYVAIAIEDAPVTDVGKEREEVLLESGVFFACSGQMYAGIGLWGKHAVLSGVQIGQREAALCMDFFGRHPGSLFSKVYDGKAEEAGIHMMLAEARPLDFTFKACLRYVENGFAGVVSYCDKNNGVAFVRDTTDKKDGLVFGYLKEGEIIPYERVTGDFSDGVELQLQRIGAVYTAVYFQNGQAKVVPSYLQANLSVARAGILYGKDANAGFSYACFGDSIHDGTSVNTPATPCKMPELTEAAAEGTAAAVWENYNIIGDSSQWEYALGGIQRTVTEGLSQLAVTNRTYGDFKIQCTLLRTGGEGAMGVTMLRSSLAEDLGDGYILSLSKDNTLSVTYRGETLFEQTLAHVSEYGLKLNLIRRKNKLYLYAGADNELSACIPDITIRRGYLGFFFENACGHVNNYIILDTDSRWMEPISPWAQNIREEGGVLVAQNGNFVMASQKGAAYTHARVSARIVPDPVEPKKEAYAGFLFAASHDMEPKRGGVLVALDGEGTVFLAKQGKKMASVSLGEKTVSAYLTVTTDGGAYAVYVSGKSTPCLVWEDTCRDGGVVSLVSENSRSGFYHVLVEDTSNEKCADGGRDSDCGSCQKQSENSADCIISRNGVRIGNVQGFTETATGEVVYQLEPFLNDREAYTLEMDITVHAPASPECYPMIYFRGKPSQKIGLYSDGTHTELITQNRGGIADVDAESTFVYVKQQEGKTYHIRIASEPDSVTVEIDGSVIYRNMRLSDCLSGDFSNLPITPEIVCVQGQTGTTRTEIKNIVMGG